MPIVQLHVLEGYTPKDKLRLGEAITDAVRLVVPAAPDLHFLTCAGVILHCYRCHSPRPPPLSRPYAPLLPPPSPPSFLPPPSPPPCPPWLRYDRYDKSIDTIDTRYVTIVGSRGYAALHTDHSLLL